MVLVHVHRFPNKQNHTRNPPKRNQLSTHNLPKRNRRGGACVPARTFAQRRFHTGNGFLCITHCAWGFNDGCALVGRHGRAHRHRPYQSPPYFSAQFHTNKITIHTQSTPNEINRPTHNLPKRHQSSTRNHPNETVGAVPVCPPVRTAAFPYGKRGLCITHHVRGI